MAAQRHGRRRLGRSDTLANCLRKFLTPAVWKQAHQAGPTAHAGRRWTLQPIVLCLLAMCWCHGDSQEERFETARGFCVMMLPKQRRPGKTVKGFEKALARLPMPALRALATAVRAALLTLLDRAFTIQGFIPLGCDGSRLRCPRTPQLEQRLGAGAQEGSAPQVWLTAVVHLSTGVLWSWWLGKGDASERHHLLRLLGTLPRNALLVADAGYQSYRLALAFEHAGLALLVRASTQTKLYTEEQTPLHTWREGIVYWWTAQAQRAGLPPLPMRLLRVPGGRHDVWLLTNVRESTRLSHELAARFYRLRWENEGFFRTYKRTLHKFKLQSRTVALLHREVEGSLLAVQLLLASGAHALAQQEQTAAVCSARQVLQEIRRDLLDPRCGGPRGWLRRLTTAIRERRQRRSPKEVRPWPGRAPHESPQPPKLLTMDQATKQLIQKHLRAA